MAEAEPWTTTANLLTIPAGRQSRCARAWVRARLSRYLLFPWSWR